ncbi:MAG: IclR family transcriptional regulator [Candidatus Binatia bacterium]
MNKNLLSTLDDALTILESLSEGSAGMGISEVSRKTGYAKSKVHRVLLTLAKRGYVRKEPQTDRYQVSLRFFALGSVALNKLESKQVATPFLEKLRDASGETAHLAVMDETSVFYIDKIESAQSIRMYSYIGRRAPIHCTAVGKALLAYEPEQRIDALLSSGLKRYTEQTITDGKKLKEELAKIRRLGYAVDNEELELGLFCIAAPIRNHLGRTVAAVSISGPGVRLTRSKIREFIPLVIRIASEISYTLGYSEHEKGIRMQAV